MSVMIGTITQPGLLVIAACALTGWWLAVRPNATYRGAGGTMSVLIVLMALLMSILAVRGQQRPRVLPSAYAMASPVQRAPVPGGSPSTSHPGR